MRILSGGYSRTFLAALMVFFISIATVMGPTPPGTGVMKLAFCLTPDRQKVRHYAHAKDVPAEIQSRSPLCLTFEIHVSNQPVLPSDRVLHSVDSNVDHRCSVFDHVCGDQVGNSWKSRNPVKLDNSRNGSGYSMLYDKTRTCSSHDDISDFSVLAKLLFWSVTVRNCYSGITCNRTRV